MQVSFTNIVECAHNSALEDAPKAGTDNTLVLGVVDRCVRDGLFEIAVAGPLIGAEQANFVRNCFVHENLKGGSGDVLNDAGDHVALAANSASDNRFTGGSAARFRASQFAKSTRRLHA
jgi:hypothetical protein